MSMVGVPTHLLVLGGIEVDLAARRIRTDDQVTDLTALEADLLRYLRARADTDVSRDELLAEVWGIERPSAPARSTSQ